MAETWTNYWYLAKDGKLIKTEGPPERDSPYVYETAERPSPQISLHTSYCSHTDEGRKLCATSDKERVLKRRGIIRELLTNSKWRQGEKQIAKKLDDREFGYAGFLNLYSLYRF